MVSSCFIVVVRKNDAYFRTKKPQLGSQQKLCSLSLAYKAYTVARVNRIKNSVFYDF